MLTALVALLILVSALAAALALLARWLDSSAPLRAPDDWNGGAP